MRRLFPQNTFVEPQMPVPSKDVARLVIGEAPGETESQTGVPFSGGSGKWFDSMLRHARIDRQGLTIANCIQCRPKDNIFPTDPEAKGYISREDANSAVSHCRRTILDPLLASQKWKRVDLLGDKPLRLIAGRTDGIFKHRGSPLSVRVGDGEFRAIATLHPSYVMRDQTMFPVVVNDLRKSLEVPPEYYSPFPSLDEVKRFAHKRFAFDIECPKYRIMGENAPVEMVGLSAKATEAMCVPVTGPYIPELKRIFLNADEIIGHNCIQFDIPKLFKVLGIEWKS